jgi:hypothetical protein
LSVLACFALCPIVRAVEPAAPDTGFPGGNTADGDGALAGLTGGFYNSAFGFLALLSNADASFNTGVGAGVLLNNTANNNTAVGAGALFSNTTGNINTALGTFALWLNTEGSANNAVGDSALFSNVTGTFNNAHGRSALFSNVGSENNAFGDLAMEFNTTGSQNTAIGDDALRNNVDGSFNVAVGDEAGTNLTTGIQNVYIGAGVGGADGDIRFIRIGDTSFTDYDCFIAGIFGRAIDAGTAVIVGIDADQKLGTVAVDANGSKVPFKPQAMMDESLKQQKRIAELEDTVERLGAMVKEQAAQIQKVSAQLEMSKPAPQVVANKP